MITPYIHFDFTLQLEHILICAIRFFCDIAIRFLWILDSFLLDIEAEIFLRYSNGRCLPLFHAVANYDSTSSSSFFSLTSSLLISSSFSTFSFSSFLIIADCLSINSNALFIVASSVLSSFRYL